MTIDEWLENARRDADRRELPALRPLLEGLAKSTQTLRAAGDPAADVVQALSQLGFSESDLRAINRENAVRLLPRFQSA